jgi:PAS domain S-box-containing protein
MQSGNSQKIPVLLELLIMVLACLAIFAFASYFGLSEFLHSSIHKFEEYRFDELIFLFIVLTCAFAYFSYRRYSESSRALDEKLGVERDREVYEKIVMASTDAMTFVDRGYMFTAVNDTMVKVWGRTSHDELIGHHVKEFIGEDLFNNNIKPIYDKCFEGEQVITQQWFEFDGYSRRFLYMIYNPYFERDRTVSGAVVVATNLTELKETEEALRKSEQKYRELIESTDNLVTQVDSYGNFMFVNHMAEKILGLRPEECIGKSAFSFIHPDDQDRTTKWFHDLINSKAASGTIENQQVSVDGKVSHMLWTSNFHYDEQGKVTIISSIASDITERLRAEENLAKSLKEKTLLLKEIHHRVKNNMAVISSLLSLQSEHVDDRKYLDMFNESRSRIRAMALVHEKLYQRDDLAHIELRDYVESLAASIKQTLSYGPAFKINTDIRDIILDIDMLVPFGLILNEIITNSVKHAFNGQDDPTISVSIKKNGKGDIRMTISDNGNGFPEGFDKSKSEGLGLKLINILSSQLNGVMEVNSDNGVEYLITCPASIEYARHLTKDG